MALITCRRRYTSEDVLTNLAHELRRLQIDVPQLPLFCAVHLVVHEIPEASLFYEMIRKLNERGASLRAPSPSASSDVISESSSSGAETMDNAEDDMEALIQYYRIDGAAS